MGVIRDRRPSEPVDPCEPCATPELVAPAAVPAEPELPPVFDPGTIHRVQAAMIDQCERLRDRVAIIDSPFAAARNGALGPGPVRAWRSRFDSPFGALYHPWLSVPDPLGRGGVRLVPPSGHIAGQYAAMDQAVGVHRAAADVAISWAQGAAFRIDAATHGLLNREGINVIAAREGRIVRALGARTLASDPQWRFVPVRRLISMLRDALDAATQWAVFEPNDDATRQLIQDSIARFLDALWRAGALAGSIAEEAYRVRCDEVNNDATRRANGELHVDIAVAPSMPMEFVVLRVGRQANRFELVEDSMWRNALIGGAN
jgi:phage tail sheath protein FI